LNSTVVRVRNHGTLPANGSVKVEYVTGGRLQQVRARYCVLTCYNAMIPALCPEPPAKLNFPVSLGDYQFSTGPDEPIVVNMERFPRSNKRGISRREQ